MKSLLAQGLLSLGIGSLCIAISQFPANASNRLIFNETPTTIERYFGRYWTRLTTRNQAGDRIVTDTYNPTKIRHLFADNGLELAITFVNNRAQSVQIRDSSAFSLRKFREEDYPDYYPPQFDDLFAIIFGYHPPQHFPLHGQRIEDDSGDGGTLHVSRYCVTQGIAISYEWISERDLALQVTLVPEAKCKRH